MAAAPTSGYRVLRRNHPVGAAFLDETGIIAKDRFFAIGVVEAPEPAKVLRRIQAYRDRTHWYTEMKFSAVNRFNLQLYQGVLAQACKPSMGVRFYCFIADRDVADPVERFGTPWDAYAKLAEQLLIGVMRPNQLLSVMADNYSTPVHVLFEEDLRAAVNRRLRRLAVVSVCRLDSKSSDGLQLVDVLTGAVAHEFRAAVGLASASSPKAGLAATVRAWLGTPSCLGGWRSGDHSVQVYEHGAWLPALRSKKGD